jgi:hypothetical protein
MAGVPCKLFLSLMPQALTTNLYPIVRNLHSLGSLHLLLHRMSRGNPASARLTVRAARIVAPTTANTQDNPCLHWVH